MVNDTKMVMNISISECKVVGFKADTTTLAPSSAPPRPQRTTEDLNEISNKIKEQQIANREKERPGSTEPCHNCGDKAARKISCSLCEKKICEGCATVELETGLSVCEDCWDKQEPFSDS